MHSQVLRYITNAAVTQNITFPDLLDSMLIATSATAVYNQFYAVRVRKVECWSLPAVGTSNSVTVQFNGTAAGIIGDQKIHTDSSMGIEPAHIVATPSRNSLANEFQIATAGSAFLLTVPSGAVVDVHLTFMSSPGIAVIAQNVGVGATVGASYYRGIDALAVATSKFTPPAGVAVI